MSKVICTLPNASARINGVNFEPHKRGVISEDLTDEQAEHFLGIAGYELDGKAKGLSPAEEAELEALRARAVELGIDVNSKWKQDRLKAEIEKAEAKKTADEGAAAKAATGGDTNTNA